MRKALPGFALGALLLGLAACAEPRIGEDVFVVLPEADGSVGEITVSDGKSTSTLNTAYGAAQLNRRGQLKPADVTAKDVDDIFGGALGAQPILPRRFVLYFELGGNELTEASRVAFEDVFKDVARRQSASVEVVGHTDTTGEQDFNAGLSQERADTLRVMLVERGISEAAIVTAGRGELDLLVETADEVPEEKNRRVEITVR